MGMSHRNEAEPGIGLELGQRPGLLAIRGRGEAGRIMSAIAEDIAQVIHQPETEIGVDRPK